MAGYAAVPNWLARGGVLTMQGKVVLLVIASRAGSKGTCYPSLMTLAKDAQVSKSTAQRAIRELASKQIISVTARTNGKGQTSNLYRVLIDLHDAGPGGHTDHPPMVTGTTEEEPPQETPLSKTLGGVVQ